MMYGSAGVVDSVCHLNGWERCSIPLHALEVKASVSCLQVTQCFSEVLSAVSSSGGGLTHSSTYALVTQGQKVVLQLLNKQ